MTEIAEDNHPPPKPPPIGLLIAVLLELSIISVFASSKMYFGLILCFIYFYFSATRSLMFPPKD